MRKGCRILFESYDLDDPNVVLSHSIIQNYSLSKPTNCLDFSLSHEDQIHLLQKTLDKILQEKTALLNQNVTQCPECSGKMIKLGHQTSTLHDVFTDHEISIQRLRCTECKYEPPCTVRALINGIMTGSLVKIQSEIGAQYSFRNSEDLLALFSRPQRKINNRNRVKNIIHHVGQSLAEIDQAEKELIQVDEAAALIVNIDGGHVKTIEAQRSIEALTSVVYRPEALVPNKKGTRNYLSNKSCAASVLDDNQEEMIKNTIVAALRQGLTPNTYITALCDGAANCWQVVESLRPLCAGMTCILDWFHITMKMQNIALPEKLKNKFLRVKWHLWRGNTEAALTRIKQLINSTKHSKSKDKLKKFSTYIENNLNRIVDYRARKVKGLVFTSHLAESTVESLINQRCKGQQHMRWSREGLDPILQLRAKIHTNDWNDKWKTVVLNSVQ